MTKLINKVAVRNLKNAVQKFRGDVTAPIAGNWKGQGDAKLWLAVIRQIAVVGNANAGIALELELSHELTNWYKSLLSATSKTRLSSIHKMLRRAGVRYVPSSSATCKKSMAAAYNFALLESYGGPKKYFSQLAAIPNEEWRISIVSNQMHYIKSKGARDLLIGLGLAKNAIALDSRLQKVLTAVGVNVPPDLAGNIVQYRALERELLDEVCKPLAVTGAHFDRILFNNWKAIIEDQK